MIQLTLSSPSAVSEEFVWEGGEGWLSGGVNPGDTVTLSLQFRDPLNAWVDSDISVVESGIKKFELPPGVSTRLASDNTGATYMAVLIQDNRRTALAT